MAVFQDLVDRVRLELADSPKQFTKQFAGDGLTTRFSLGVKPIDAATLLVTVDGNPMANPDDYTLEDTFGVIHLVTPPAINSVVEVTGSAWRYFTDTEISLFVNTAVTQHTANKTDSFGSLMTVARIPAVEEYPVVILSVIEALWALATDAAYDVDITAPDGVHIPRAQRFSQLTGIINQRMQQYKDLCAALNVGLWRIEMGTLRRVSRTTNKLVPVYVPQEIDDSRRPERVFIQNDLLGRNPQPTTAQIYDICFTQNNSWEATFDFPWDLTGYTVKAQIRTYPNSPSLYATFTVTYVDRAAGKVKLSLTPKDSEYMPMRAYWDMLITADSDPNWKHTYIKGQVFVDQQVTVD